MLVSLVAELEAVTTAALPSTHGLEMQGRLFHELNRLDRTAATARHGGVDGRLRPYTISPIHGGQPRGGNLFFAAGECGWFRVTGLNEDMSRLLVAMSERTRAWELGGPSFQMDFHIRRWSSQTADHPWAGMASAADLQAAAWACADRDPGHIALEFDTPTTFELDSGSRWGNWMHVPLPALVFGSLRNRLAAFCPDLGNPPGDAAWFDSMVALGRYQLGTHMMFFQGRNRRRAGFTGYCEYLLHPQLALPDRLWLHIMGAFSFFAGVGAATSWGMGQARRIVLEGRV